jgi:putative spermidine/putrescine transport system ATP-binding protein
VNNDAVIGGSKAPRQSRDGSTLLHVSNLTKAYGDVVAVDNVSLEVRRGELMTFLGPSGSGKTTTLNMIAGFDLPTSGRIMIEGQDISQVAPNHRNIGMVFQRYTLWPHMTVAENVGFPLSVRGVAKAEIAKRVARFLKLIRLETYGGRRPSQLSGGQQQRVALARALIYEPRLLLMDEPLGALDKRLREEIQLEIRHIHQALDVTIIYVTHDQEEALRLSDRIAVFNNGHIVQVGDGRELYDRPANAFVGAFLGNSNFLNGHLGDTSGGRSQVRLEGGPVIEVPARPEFGRDRPVSVMFRPERATVESAGATRRQTNRLTARVVESVFLGDCVTYSVRVGGGQLLTIKQPHGISEPRQLAFDEEVEVCWPVDCTHVFAAEG